jgi:protein-S-isoprenylcysteine O-methyltransferase Ste14
MERMAEKLRKHMTWIFAFLFTSIILFSGSMWDVTFPLLNVLLSVVGIFLAAAASMGRVWCSLYIGGYKTDRLITVGPYSICRNPLYFFSLLGGIGVGLASETFTIPLMILCGFCLYYPFVILSEEKHLLTIHGKEYETYLRTTPAFFPKPSLLIEPTEYAVKTHVFRRRMLGALYFVWLVGIIELIEEIHDLKLLPIFFRLY